MRRELILAVAGLAFAFGTAGVPVQGVGVFETSQAQAWNPAKAAKKAAKKVGGAAKKVGKGAVKGAKKVGKTAGKVARGAGRVVKKGADVSCRVLRPTAKVHACKDVVDRKIRAAKKKAHGAAQTVGRAIYAGRKIGEAVLDDRVRIGIPDLSKRGVRRPGTRDHRSARRPSD